MKRYPHIISKLFFEPLLLTPEKHRAICRALQSHLDGGPRFMPDPMDDEKPDPEYKMVQGVSIIPVYGILGKHLEPLEMSSGGCDLDDIATMIDVAEKNPKVERIIFDFRTPGGTVVGVPETARKIYSIDGKETIAFTDSECCSAGLWLASQCRKFYATASSRIGSVGVWTAYLDLSRQMQNEGANMQSFSAGEHKLMGAYWKPLTDDEKEIIQARVDKIYSEFIAAVNVFRSVSPENLGTGLVYDGIEATQIGFTDGVVESIDDILDGFVE